METILILGGVLLGAAFLGSCLKEGDKQVHPERYVGDDRVGPAEDGYPTVYRDEQVFGRDLDGDGRIGPF